MFLGRQGGGGGGESKREGKSIVECMAQGPGNVQTESGEGKCEAEERSLERRTVSGVSL